MKASQGLGRSLILLNFVLFIQTNGQISNIQRCGDPQCQGKTKFLNYIFLTLYNWQLFLTTTFLVTGPISEGRTLLKYHANSNSMLSFTNNQPVLIFSKGDGSQTDIWGVEVIKNVILLPGTLDISQILPKTVHILFKNILISSSFLRFSLCPIQLRKLVLSTF